MPVRDNDFSIRRVNSAEAPTVHNTDGDIVGRWYNGKVWELVPDLYLDGYAAVATNMMKDPLYAMYNNESENTLYHPDDIKAFYNNHPLYRGEGIKSVYPEADLLMLGPETIGTGAKYLFNKAILKSPFLSLYRALRYPRWLLVYHGGADIPTTELRFYSPKSIGLHVSPYKDVAEHFAMDPKDGETGAIHTFLVPRKNNAKIFDTYLNNIMSLLGENYSISTDISSLTPFYKGSLLWKEAKKLGIKLKPLGLYKVDHGYITTFDTPTETRLVYNPRELFFPKVRKLDVEPLVNEYSSLIPKRNDLLYISEVPPEGLDRLSDISRKGTEILSNAGYKKIIYLNVANEEGAGTSYMLTDPSIIRPIPAGWTPKLLINPNYGRLSFPFLRHSISTDE